MSNEHYSGPFVNITFADGSAEAVKGTVEVVTGQLRGGGLHELETVYNQPVTVNGDHVMRIDSGGEFSVTE